MEELLCVRVKPARKDEMAIKESEKKTIHFHLVNSKAVLPAITKSDC